MAYYPKSQIKTNLYSEGEYILIVNNKPYIGYYYELSNGKKYTGKTPQDTPNLELTLPIDAILIDGVPTIIDKFGLPSPNNVIPLTPFDGNFNVGLNNPATQRSLPTPIQPRPTIKDYDLGVFSRYIVKKNNENTYIEINKEQFLKFQNRDEDVAWDLYTPKEILWQIKGDKTQTYTTNRNIIKLVENREKWYGFTQWFKDRFLKYYIGKDFHVMPDGSIMEGKTHENGKNLISIKLPKNTSTQSNSTTPNNPSGGGY
jgi:hypothetical protein